MAVIIIIAIISFAIAWPDIAARQFSVNAIVSIITGVLLFLLTIIVLVIIKNIVDDFIILIMYKHNIKLIEAAVVFKHEILSEHISSFILFYIMKIVLSMAIGVIVLIAFCLTCCIACCISAIPYIGTVFLLPLIMFKRCYSIFFLEQFGEKWQFIESNLNNNEI